MSFPEQTQLEIIIVRELSQNQKDGECVFSLICGFSFLYRHIKACMCIRPKSRNGIKGLVGRGASGGTDQSSLCVCVKMSF